MIWFLLGGVFVLSLLYVLMLEVKDEHEPPGVRGVRALLITLKGIRSKAGPLSIQADLNSRYGDIAQLTLPNGRRTVCIGTHQMLKEAYSKIELAGRPDNGAKRKGGLVNANGRMWREQRRFALHTLRDFGMGKSVQEDIIIHECAELVKQMGKHENSFDPRFYIGSAVTNVICATIFSDRFDYGAATLNDFLEMITVNLSRPNRRLALILPFLKHLPSIKADLDIIIQNRATIGKIVQKYIEEHRESYQEGNIRDYIDAYLAAQEKEKEQEETTFTAVQLTESVQDLFSAGSETTGTTLRWGLALMALNPEVQSKVYQDIMNVIGKDRLPSMSDKVNMPYTEAVLLEIQRYGSIVPMITHEAVEPCSLGNYHIKQGTIVMVNVLNLNREKKIWPYPEEFNVDNFYKNGEIINRNYFIAFSMGKRSCLGESLAKMETFLFFVALIQKFEFLCCTGEEPNLSDPDVGVIRMPKPYKIRIKKRD